jgi:hypothetical protein
MLGRVTASRIASVVSRVEFELSNRQEAYLDSVGLNVGGTWVLKYL